MSEKITASHIKSALATKYCPPEWCVFFEVADQSGGYSKRYADAVSMSIWPSRGYQIHGHEIKVSRSDFNAEMKDPHKSDAVGQYCDYWWLVTPPKLVEPEELPETWGLMVLQKNGLRIKKQAPKKQTNSLDRGFAAALLRRSTDMQSQHVRKQVDKGNAERAALIRDAVEQRTKHIATVQQKNTEWIRKFEAALGCKFETWEIPERLAASLKLAKMLDNEYSSASISRLLEGCQRLSGAIEEFQGDGEATPAMTISEAARYLESSQ